MATSPFSNVGLGQIGQENSFSGGEGTGLGRFLLGAALSSLGAPKEITSLVSKDKAVAPPNSLPISAPSMSTNIPAAVVPGQPIQNPEDERNSFSQGFKGLFSHLPTFGNK
jgi:hypothetical protein